MTTSTALPRICSTLVAWITALVMGVALQAAQSPVPEGWLQKYDDAIAAAKKSERPVLADFTGSDWCGWCIRLKEEVFDTKEFKEWAAANVVLLEVDFPQKKPQDAAIKARNEQLAQEFAIQGFPTILIMDGKGKKIGELGYMAGGPKVWIAEFVKQYRAAGGGK